jgi:GNAT superfamily N-acetyltransferase
MSDAFKVSWIASADVPERPEVLRQRDRIAVHDLGDDLDPDLYIEIESTMWHHPFSRSGLRVWTLEQSGELVATFDTFDVVTRVRRADGTVAACRGACLASGFVAPEHRLAGHGRRLSGEIGRELACSGYGFFYGIAETTMKVYSEIEAGTFALVGVAWPRAKDLPDRADPIANLAGWTAPPLHGSVDVLLTAEMLAWRHDRVGLERPQDCARPIGARQGDGWIVWVSAPDRDALEILHLRGDAANGPGLIAAARCEAAARGFAEAIAWDNPTLAPWLPSGERRPLDEVLAIRTFAPGLSGAGWLDPQIGHYF